MSWKKKFFTIAIGQTVSLVGSSAVQFALIWWIASETKSPLVMGIAGLVAYLPMTLLSPVAGLTADRYNRKYVCISADLFIGLVAAVFAVLLWVCELPIWSAVLILLFRGIGSTFHQPAIQAMIPQIVPEEHLVKAGAWNQMMSSGAFILGPVLGALLYAAFPMPVILLTDLAGAVAASSMLALVAIPKVERIVSQMKSPFQEYKEGIQVYREDKKLFLIIAAETLCMVFFLPLSSFYPLMTSNYFQGNAWHASVVELSFALGMMGTATLFGSVIRVRKHFKVSYLGLLGIGITSAICGILPRQMWGWWIFTVTCGFMGGFGNVHTIPLIAYMQSSIPPEKMGRAFSLLGIMGSLTMPVGLLLAGPVAELVGVSAWFLISGIAMTLITVTAALRHRKIKV